ncbi:MAG: MerR family transcriptional regulator [Corynebacterium sp.]|nr:MerR family transcriptional regulator [Corynebacterium sp.]
MSAQLSVSGLGNPSPRAKEPTFTIGQVVDMLTAQFPDLSQSKVRYLDKQGLVCPQRTTKGYRRFTEKDIERLRYVLTMQRDHYTPHKVLLEQLEAFDKGEVASLDKALVSQEAPSMVATYTLVELADASDVDIAFLSDLLSLGLLTKADKGIYADDHVRIVKSCFALAKAGVDLRQVSRLKNSAVRQYDVIRAKMDQRAQARDVDAKQAALENGQYLASLVMELNAAVLGNLLREEERK